MTHARFRSAPPLLTVVALSTLVLGAAAFACRRGSAPAAERPATGAPAVAQRLGSTGAATATPVLASSGRWVVAAWTETRDSRTNVYAATSDDNGVRFGSPVRVNDVDGEARVSGEDAPRVAIGGPRSSGATAAPGIVVTWPSARAKKLGLRSALSNDWGKTFSPSTSIGDPDIEAERGFQSVTIGQDHVMRAAWLDRRRDAGTLHRAHARNDWNPMHVMYAFGSRDGWNQETGLASNVCSCCKTAIATGRDGSVYVAWRNIYPGNLRDISFAVSRNGRTFSPAVRVSQDQWSLNPCPDDGPTMQVDLAGGVHIVWPTLADGPEPAMRFFHASSVDGATFTPRQPIPTLGTPRPSHPQMTVDDCGTLVLVWDEEQGKSRRALLRQLTPRGSRDVHVGDVQVISAQAVEAVYPVVTPVIGGVLAAWTEVNTASERSSVALRRIHLEPSCQASITTTP